MAETPKEQTAEAVGTATVVTDETAETAETAATLSPSESVAAVYQYKPAGKYEQAAKEFRPDPVKYKFLPPRPDDSATPQNYSTVERENFLGLIDQYDVEKNFGEGSLRDGKPCLIKAFEKLSFSEFNTIRESIKTQKGETDPLVKHLETLDEKKFKSSTFNPSEVQSMVAILKEHDLLPKIQQKRSVTLTELLGGKEKLKVFKAALAEEVNSPEFLKALWEHSLKPHYGDKNPNTFAIQIMSGASGSGKSFAGEQAVDREYPLAVPTPVLSTPTFWMAWVDGGIARDINVTQQYVKMLSLELGVEVDLSKDSKKILEPTKKRVKTAIIDVAKGNPEDYQGIDRMKIGIVEPLTYSSDIVLGDVKKEIQTVRELAQALPEEKQVQLSYDYVSGNDFEEHAKVVETQGVNRAFPTTGQAQSEFEKINPQVKAAAAASQQQTRLERFMSLIPKIRFAENKKYGPGGYQYGVNGSVHGFIEYEKAFGDPNSRVKLSRHINCNDLRVFTIDGEEEHSGQERHVFSERLVADWKALKDDPLSEYAKKNELSYTEAGDLKRYTENGVLWNEAEHQGQASHQLSERLVEDWKASKNLMAYASKNRSNPKYSNFMTNFNPKDLKFGLSSEVEKIFQSNFQKKASLVSVSPNNLGYLVPFLNILDRLHQTKDGKEAYNDPEQIKVLIAELSQLIAEKRKENLGKKLNPFASSNTLPLMEKTLQKLIKREALLARKEILSLKKDLVNKSLLMDSIASNNEKKSKEEEMITLLNMGISARRLEMDQFEKQIKSEQEKFYLFSSKRVEIISGIMERINATIIILESLELEKKQTEGKIEGLQRTLGASNLELERYEAKQQRLDTLWKLSPESAFYPPPVELESLDETIEKHLQQLKTEPQDASESESEKVRDRTPLKTLLLDPNGIINYPFSQKLYDLSLARIQGDDHKNAEYLIALNQIIASIDPNNKDSIENGIRLLNELERIKSENKKGLSSGRSNTSQLIDEVKSYFETRLEVVKTFEFNGDFEQEIKKIDEELNEQLKPEPVKGWFVAWAEKVIESFIGWLATKKDMSQADVKSALTKLKEGLTIGWMFHVLINFITYAFSSKLLDSPQNQTGKLRASLLEKNQGSLQVDNTEEEENRKSQGPQNP